jgi:hypothetical protein
MKNPNHAIFRPPTPSEDSCVAAMQLANERYLRRRSAQRGEKLISATEEASQEEHVEPTSYEAGDDDLPRIFF